MFLFIVLMSVVALSVNSQQYQADPRTAAIISEQRYLSGDGKFGAAYTQEDGTDFKEETDSDGTRRGSYSYIDPNGQKRSISYTAGKDGFQASGDHLPVAPPAPAHAQLAAQQAANYQPRSYDSGNAAEFDDGQYDPRYNDPSFEGNGRGVGVQPSYVSQPSYAQQQPIPQQQYVQPQPQQQAYNPANNVNYVSQYQSTTQNPHRFQPPGKLSLSRTPDGFSYTFNKV